MKTSTKRSSTNPMDKGKMLNIEMHTHIILKKHNISAKSICKILENKDTLFVTA